MHGFTGQKLLFLHQLTHNMTKNCSWNYHENYKRRTWPEHCGLIDAKIRASDKDLPVYATLYCDFIVQGIYLSMVESARW